MEYSTNTPNLLYYIYSVLNVTEHQSLMSTLQSIVTTVIKLYVGSNCNTLRGDRPVKGSL